MAKEIWKDIAGHEGRYEVSNIGRVRSLDRFVANRYGQRLAKGKVISDSVNIRGYPMVHLYRNGKRLSITVHKIVAEAFICPRPEGLVANHKDGVKTNNNVSNLEWVTRSENMCHAYATGLTTGNKFFGESNGRSKLTAEDVISIRHECGNGAENLELAEKYNVSTRTISDIKFRTTWKHI